MSRYCFSMTESFHGKRTIGTVGIPERTRRCVMTSCSDTGACSPSMRIQSNPARASPSVTLKEFSIDQTDRKSVVYGKSVSVRVDLGGRRIIKKKHTRKRNLQSNSQNN